jgi:hypothetical protein
MRFWSVGPMLRSCAFRLVAKEISFREENERSLFYCATGLLSSLEADSEVAHPGPDEYV